MIPKIRDLPIVVRIYFPILVLIFCSESAVPKRGHSKRSRMQKERKRALPRKNCKQPGLKQPGLGTADRCFSGRSARELQNSNLSLTEFAPSWLIKAFPWKTRKNNKYYLKCRDEPQQKCKGKRWPHNCCLFCGNLFRSSFLDSKTLRAQRLK